MAKKSKNKFKKQLIKVDDEVYMSGVNVFLNYSKDELLKEIDKIMGGHSDELNDMDNFEGRHFVIENPQRKQLERFVWIGSFQWTCVDMAKLFHEITHLVLRILEDRGVPISEKNSETIAYLMEFYSREIMRQIKK